MNLFKNRPVRALISIMVVVVTIGVLIAWNYYKSANASVDPRIIEARELYSKFDSCAASGNYYNLFSLLDSIEDIYISTDHYIDSYEVGVIKNNRAAALLTIALYTDSIALTDNPYKDIADDSLVNMAEKNLLAAISIYNRWNNSYKDKAPGDISREINSQFLAGLNSIDLKKGEKYLESRVKEIEKSVLETDRRLSVCYTNLGVVYRLRGDNRDAVMQYEKALELWDRNLEAENNINRLLGQPVKKRNIIQKLFPPDRDDGNK